MSFHLSEHRNEAQGLDLRYYQSIQLCKRAQILFLWFVPERVNLRRSSKILQDMKNNLSQRLMHLGSMSRKSGVRAAVVGLYFPCIEMTTAVCGI